MSISENKAQRMITWLSDAIMTEMAKPYTEIDTEFVDSCEQLLDTLLGERRLSDNEINDMLKNITRNNKNNRAISVKRKTKSVFIALIAAIIFLFSCVTICAFTPIGESIVKKVLFTESQVKFSMKTNLEVTTVGDTEYGFEESISIDDRYDYIVRTEKILDRLDPDNSISINIYAKETYDEHVAIGSAVHSYLEDLTDLENAMDIIFATYGEYCNYGLVYGYANYILNDLSETKTVFSDPIISAENKYLALNYLCFHPDFASDEDISINQNIANAFVSDYISENGEKAFIEILKASGNVEKVDISNKALSDYYLKHGVSVFLTRNLYKDGGQADHYCVMSEYATFEIPENWVDGLTLWVPYHYGEDYDYPNLYDGFLNNDYAKTERFFNVNLEQMRQYEKLFSLEKYRRNVLITFQSARSAVDSSHAHKGNVIYIKNLSSVISLYLFDILRYAGGYQEWKADGFRNYYAFRYDEYGNAMIEHDWLCCTDLGKLFVQKTERPIDFKNDIYMIYNIRVYQRYIERGEIKPQDSVTHTVSFIDYLVNNYDEQKVIEYFTVTNDLKTFTDKKFPELVEDWIDYLEETCAVYFEE